MREPIGVPRAVALAAAEAGSIRRLGRGSGCSLQESPARPSDRMFLSRPPGPGLRSRRGHRSHPTVTTPRERAPRVDGTAAEKHILGHLSREFVSEPASAWREGPPPLRGSKAAPRPSGRGDVPLWLRPNACRVHSGGAKGRAGMIVLRNAVIVDGSADEPPAPVDVLIEGDAIREVG